jgi:hypothetical protein
MAAWSRASCLALLLVAKPLAQTAAVEPVRFAFTARVQNVYDPIDALQGAIQVGDLVQGTFTYDPAAPDADPRPGVGRYEHRRAPYGVLAAVGGLSFETDPEAVDLTITIANDEGAPPRDRYLLESRRNLRLSNGASVSRISWQLDDETRRALEGEALPPAPPDLATWQSEFGLTLEGGDTVGYIVRAHIIHVSRCRNPSACF